MKLRNSRYAFTLIEILVVLVIMGFLVAMVSPKLAGVISFSQDPIDEANQKELSKVFHDFVSLKERLPRQMLNLIHKNGDDYEMLRVLYEDEGVILSEKFELKLVPIIHHLDADEALELRRLGVRHVRNYQHSYSGGGTEYNSDVNISKGVAVLMLGCGADSAGAFDWNSSLEGSIFDDNNPANLDYRTANVEFDNDTDDTYAFNDTAPYLGRIVMGIDNENELVVRGYLDESGTSPKEVQSGEVKYLHYSVLLPRLKATVARMGTKNIMHLRKYDKDVKNKYGKKEIKMENEEQNIWDIVIVSPQGYISRDKDFSYGVKIDDI